MRPRLVLFYPSGSLSKRFLRTQPVYHGKDSQSDPVTTSSGSGPGNNNDNDTSNGQPDWLPSLASPRQLVEYLNDYVVGQTRAKKILAVAYVFPTNNSYFVDCFDQRI